jgi:hypothetical protein
MIKKLGLMLAAVAVVAFAAPSMAGAHAVTKAKNELAPVNAKMAVFGDDVTLTSSLLGTITCEELDTRVALTKNNGVEWEASGALEAPPEQAGCANFAKPVKVTSLEVSKIRAGGAETWMNFKVTLDITAGEHVLECTYTGTKVPFTYVAGEEEAKKGIATFTKAAGVAGTNGCGTATLDGTFTFLIGGAIVILD